MEHRYKGHLIRTRAAPIRDKTEWKTIAQVNWTEQGIDRVKLWMDRWFVRSYKTCDEAELQGHNFAKSWIDGKPKAHRG